MYRLKCSLRWEDKTQTAAVIQAEMKFEGFLKLFKNSFTLGTALVNVSRRNLLH